MIGEVKLVDRKAIKDDEEYVAEYTFINNFPYYQDLVQSIRRSEGAISPSDCQLHKVTKNKIFIRIRKEIKNECK